MLHLTTAELDQITADADRLYRIGRRLRKKDGTIRLCFKALAPLESVQARIRCLILKKVTYPCYLQGCIKDRTSPRGQAANARLHVGRRILITEDIKQFFPSVRRPVIFDVWHRFFRFPPAVAECLTRLTTKEGILPQGAKTSDLLANLVFWEDEWRLVADLHARGITYSRLIDDIDCSSSASLPPAELTHCIEAIRTMCKRKGLQLKRQKQTIVRDGARMVATKLVVNTKTSLPAEQRSVIRAAVAAVTEAPSRQRNTKDYGRRYRRAAGQVSYLKQHHPHEAEELRARLRDARPCSSS
jgi:retron-type reverse transcriptase